MGHRIAETQEFVRVSRYYVAKDRAVLVWIDPELIDDDDYAEGVFESLKEAWDRGDFFFVEYVSVEPGTGAVLHTLASIGGMAGYGGSEAAACAAAHDYFDLPTAELESLRKQAGCDFTSMMRAPSKGGVKFDLDGPGDEDEGEEDDESEDVVEDEDTPQDDDYFIHSGRGGGYYVTQHGKVLWDFRADDYAEVERVIWQHMEASQFWPNVWRVGERGDTDIVILKPPKAVKFDLDGIPGGRGGVRGTLPSWARPRTRTRR